MKYLLLALLALGISPAVSRFSANSSSSFLSIEMTSSSIFPCKSAVKVLMACALFFLYSSTYPSIGICSPTLIMTSAPGLLKKV
jgi:hypothetical protein